MTLNAILHYSAACFCAGMAIFALLRDHRSFVHRIFALGLAALAIESVFVGLAAQALLPEQAIGWQHRRLIAEALLPGIWLLFGLSFAQEDLRSVLAKWKWAVLAAFFPNLVFVSIFQAAFYEGSPIQLPNGWAFELGWSGYAFKVCFLLSLVLNMMVLERILRASQGRKRWQVKFFVLGIGGLFAVRLYTVSYVLVYHTQDLEFEVINAVVLLVANLLVLISIFRAGTFRIDIYISQKMLYNSFTLIVVGVYFLALGLAVQTLTGYLALPLRALIVFLALLGLVIALSSDRIRLEIKRFVSRHLRRPQYDYRKVWKDFTTRTAALVEEKPLCEAVAKIISEMFDILSVSIWLSDARQDKLRCCASTALSVGRACTLLELQDQAADIMRLLTDQSNFLDLEDPQTSRASRLTPAQMKLMREARIRFVVALAGGGDLLGFISLGDRVKDQPLSFEELDLLRAIADQVAAALLNVKLSERLRQAGEMEAFQTIAVFFVHDLKNLASKLSMMLKNLPVHFDNPEFRADALRMLSKSVGQVDGMCSRLSSLREKLEIRPVETDLNAVVAATLAAHNGLPAASLVENLQPVPKVMADPEQLQKVLTNLILNAGDAVGNGGQINVTTGMRDGWVELGVSDTGCGISKEFMDQCLFRPFRTTKTQGTGIGLFQSKMIVDAHNGVIEVESQEGRGSTFRVLLPIK